MSSLSPAASASPSASRQPVEQATQPPQRADRRRARVSAGSAARAASVETTHGRRHEHEADFGGERSGSARTPPPGPGRPPTSPPMSAGRRCRRDPPCASPLGEQLTAVRRLVAGSRPRRSSPRRSRRRSARARARRESRRSDVERPAASRWPRRVSSAAKSRAAGRRAGPPELRERAVARGREPPVARLVARGEVAPHRQPERVEARSQVGRRGGNADRGGVRSSVGGLVGRCPVFR